MSLDTSKRVLRSAGFTVSVDNTFCKASDMADNWARTSGAKTLPAGRGALPKNQNIETRVDKIFLFFDYRN